MTNYFDKVVSSHSYFIPMLVLGDIPQGRFLTTVD